VASWSPHDADLAALVDALAAVYRDGYGELAFALHAAGWRDSGAGMLDALVDAIHALRSRGPDGSAADITETRLAVAAMHSAMATDPVYGAAFRRSAGIRGAAANDSRPQVSWWVAALTSTLELRPGHRAPGTHRQ
jgi:hypothetical protein